MSETTSSKLLLAGLVSVGGMILMIIGSIALFGESAEDGPLQVAMMFGLSIAMLSARSLGFTMEELSAAMSASINSALGTIFVLLAIGALIGALFVSGTIAAVIYYGAQIGTPHILYLLVLVIATVLATAIGSSFTTIAAVGLPFVALAPAMEVSPVVTAAAAVCGAFAGDALGRISDTFILTSTLVGADTKAHQKTLMRVLLPGWVASAVLFTYLGFQHGGSGSFDPAPVNDLIETRFLVSPLAFLPLVIVLVLSVRTTAFLSIMAGAVSAIILAGFQQSEMISQTLADDSLGRFAQWFKISLISLGTGFELNSGDAMMDKTFSGGGVVSMLTTVWLILVAAAFGAVVDHSGMLQRLLKSLLNWADRASRVIAASAITSVGLNAATADPYMSIILGTNTYRQKFMQFRLQPKIQSVSVAASGTIASPLIPWNVHGAYAGGTLGVGVLSYAPYALLLWATPLVLIFLGFIKFNQDVIPGSESPQDVYGNKPEKLPERRTSV
ncbi:transporter (NhaC family) [Aliiruegeria haliotis]|uniref:Transporter (NhaC family) n=1 Tax=Aliiruegeria haliotis TaxID=1280846 RepID=A0A2T0RGH8_9RHOB|nr:Na+/H+ antiporter NhaC family protein [Aliiruegeria haliotis]PRY20231.1 transporter (NhaC family) [Aliiruegeria haliotis]